MFGTKGINTTPISQKAILERVSEYDLWVYYLGHCKLNKAFNSPLRKDKKPSAVLFVASNSRILFKDFATGEIYDIFKFIQTLGYDYRDTLYKIDSDFQLGFNSKAVKPNKIPVISDYKPEYNKKLSQIMIKRKSWDKKALDYWKEYNVSLDILESYKVSSIQYFWVVKDKNVHLYEAKNPTFCYDLGEQKYKIYRPYEHNYRFITNAENDVLQGVDNLPNSAELLVITKAMKDVMVLHSLGYNAVAVQSESSFPSEPVINALKCRFGRIIVLFDNDDPGVKGSEKFCSKFGLDCISLPKDSKCKDIAEYIKLHGQKQTKYLLKWLIETEQQDIIGKEK